MNSICYAPDGTDDIFEKNEQIKSMLRVIDRIAYKYKFRKISPVPFSYIKHVEAKTKQTFLQFHPIQEKKRKTQNAMSHCVREYFLSYYITLIIIYRIFFIQLSIVHILIKWIECSSKRMIIYLTFISHLVAALYRNNIDNLMLVIIIRCISKCMCVYILYIILVIHWDIKRRNIILFFIFISKYKTDFFHFLVIHSIVQKNKYCSSYFSNRTF